MFSYRHYLKNSFLPLLPALRSSDKRNHGQPLKMRIIITFAIYFIWFAKGGNFCDDVVRFVMEMNTKLVLAFFYDELVHCPRKFEKECYYGNSVYVEMYSNIITLYLWYYSKQIFVGHIKKWYLTFLFNLDTLNTKLQMVTLFFNKNCQFRLE